MSLRSYIETEFADAALIENRTFTKPGFDALVVENRSLIRNVKTHDAKYGVKKSFAGDLGFIDFSFVNLAPRDIWGAGYVTSKLGDTFMAGAFIDLGANYGDFTSYKTTNRDGITLNSSGGFYGEDITLGHFQDGGIDSKSTNMHLNRLLCEWKGKFSLRYWTPGPHVLTNSVINNTRGKLLWSDEASLTLYVFNCLFNGQSTIPDDQIEIWRGGGKVNIVYLDTAAEAEALMHPGFGSIGTSLPEEMVDAPPADAPEAPPPADPPAPPPDPALASLIAANMATIAGLSVRLSAAEGTIARLKAYAMRDNFDDR